MTVDEEATSWIVCVAFTTVSFMHCKNVVQRVVAPPPKLSKRHKERHGRPLFSYRVLEIEPMKQAKVRKAKLYYMTDYSKRLKEKTIKKV